MAELWICHQQHWFALPVNMYELSQYRRCCFKRKSQCSHIVNQGYIPQKLFTVACRVCYTSCTTGYAISWTNVLLPNFLVTFQIPSSSEHFRLQFCISQLKKVESDPPQSSKPDAWRRKCSLPLEVLFVVLFLYPSPIFWLLCTFLSIIFNYAVAMALAFRNSKQHFSTLLFDIVLVLASSI